MNPYQDIQQCVNRLITEHDKHNQLIIAYDFDGTVFNFPGNFSDIEQNESDHKEVLDLLRTCQKRGFYLCVFTASAPSRYPKILEYCKQLGITPHTINENPIPLPFGNHGKIYYNLLLDDRAGLSAATETLRRVLFHLENREN